MTNSCLISNQWHDKNLFHRRWQSRFHCRSRARHPDLSENLAWVGALLDRCPNFHVDISARLGELGRQPYTARRFFLRYADRILFGSDMGPYPEAYRVIYRFLETDDEYFNYNAAPIPMQGRWHVHGLYLPDDVLEKVYFRNAERILLNQG